MIGLLLCVFDCADTSGLGFDFVVLWRLLWLLMFVVCDTVVLDCCFGNLFAVVINSVVASLSFGLCLGVV